MDKALLQSEYNYEMNKCVLVQGDIHSVWAYVIEDILFWIPSGMGTKNGVGLFVTKQDFILKYGEDYDYYQEQFELRRKEQEQKLSEIKKK